MVSYSTLNKLFRPKSLLCFNFQLLIERILGMEKHNVKYYVSCRRYLRAHSLFCVDELLMCDNFVYGIFSVVLYIALILQILHILCISYVYGLLHILHLLRQPFVSMEYMCIYIYIYIYLRGVTGGTDQTSGGCSLCYSIPI